MNTERRKQRNFLNFYFLYSYNIWRWLKAEKVRYTKKELSHKRKLLLKIYGFHKSLVIKLIHNVRYQFKTNNAHFLIAPFLIFIFCNFKFLDHFTQIFRFTAHLLTSCCTFFRCCRIRLYDIIDLFNSIINLLDFCCLCL